MPTSVPKKNARLQDIASALKISVSTVSRALVGHKAISEETREAVQRTAVLMGYASSRPGKRKRSVPTRTIGVLLSVDQMHNRFMTLVLENIHHDMLDFRYHVIVFIDSMNSPNDVAHLATFRPIIDEYLEGMILLSTTTDSFVVRELQRLGVPLVVAVRSVDDSKVDIVESDNAYGGAEIMRHLYELGHRRIGLVMGPENASTSRDRARGALNYLREKGVPTEHTPIMWNAFTYEAGYSCATQMLDLDEPVTAIMAGGDSIALGVLEAARVKNIGVPSQLSVVGFDNIPLSGSRLISLTTINASAKEMARVACRRMMDRIRTGALTPPIRDVMPVQLVRRDTSAAPHPSKRD
jgi:LacI family transcriptional regulator